MLAFFLGVRLEQKNVFKKIIYFKLMFEKFLQQTESAVILYYKIFFFILQLDQQLSWST